MHFRNVGSAKVLFSNIIDLRMCFPTKVAAPFDSLLLPLQYYASPRKTSSSKGYGNAQ